MKLLNRSTITFLSDPEDHYSHRVRIVLAEKAIAVNIEECALNELPEKIQEFSTSDTLPILRDRSLYLSNTKVMMEYLDERFPHPPLLPIYPIDRAITRSYIYRLEKEWVPLMENILKGKGTDTMRKELRDGIISLASVFADKPFFMSDEFSIADCCLIPILWRLQLMKIELPKVRQTRALLEYMDRCFKRPSVENSLSDLEQEMMTVASG